MKFSCSYSGEQVCICLCVCVLWCECVCACWVTMFPALIKLVPSHLCDMAHVKDYTPKSFCLSLASFVVPISLFNSFLPPLGVFFKLNLPNPDTTHPTITFTELSTTGHMSPALSTLWPETRQLRTVSVPPVSQVWPLCFVYSFPEETWNHSCLHCPLPVCLLTDLGAPPGGCKGRVCQISGGP